MTGQLTRNIEAMRLCAAEGLTYSETAAKLGLSIGTIRSYASKGEIKFATLRTDASIRLEELRAYAEAGLTRKETAAKLGVSLPYVSVRSAQLGLKFAKPRGNPDARSHTMAVMFRNGYTLKAIGEQYGITRERVRQIITKHHGLTAKDGGEHFRAQIAQEKRKAKADARSMAKHGCLFEQYQTLLKIGKDLMASGVSRERTPAGAFHRQKHNATRTRGIAWELTLWQWWTIWQSSGHWEERGRGQGYVMCRKGDEGPYSVGNVFIALAIENNSNTKSKKSTLPIGVRKNKYKGYSAVRQLGGVEYRLGSFATPELAHAAYLAAAPIEGAAA